MATLKTPMRLLLEAPNMNLFSEEKTGISLDSSPFGFVSEAKQTLVSVQCANIFPLSVCEELFYSLVTKALMDNQQRFEELAKYRNSNHHDNDRGARQNRHSKQQNNAIKQSPNRDGAGQRGHKH